MVVIRGRKFETYDRALRFANMIHQDDFINIIPIDDGIFFKRTTYVVLFYQYIDG